MRKRIVGVEASGDILADNSNILAGDEVEFESGADIIVMNAISEAGDEIHLEALDEISLNLAMFISPHCHLEGVKVGTTSPENKHV